MLWPFETHGTILGRHHVFFNWKPSLIVSVLAPTNDPVADQVYDDRQWHISTRTGSAWLQLFEVLCRSSLFQWEGISWPKLPPGRIQFGVCLIAWPSSQPNLYGLEFRVPDDGNVTEPPVRIVESWSWYFLYISRGGAPPRL